MALVLKALQHLELGLFVILLATEQVDIPFERHEEEVGESIGHE